MNDVINAHYIDEHRHKREYAKKKIRKLAPTHLDILEALNEAGAWRSSEALEEPVTKKRFARGGKRKVKQSQISGRLSELGRIGLVEVDEEEWIWMITEKGKRALKLRRIP